MFHQHQFDKYAAELEQDLEEGFITQAEFRTAMRELIEEFTEAYGGNNEEE